VLAQNRANLAGTILFVFQPSEEGRAVDGGPGDDWIYGEAGDDILKGGRGSDRLLGG